ncbi:DUF461 domain-containing protein [Streptomyces sp. NPDC058459]|uniref:DUF461 domain-containing protein n=1 Tax=Streptomyces sp. NPDC058459 TaxID=3346508 RepID=UPI003659B86D
MSSSLRRGALAASAIAFSIASLAACGAGNNAQTLEIKPDNAATSVGVIKVQNAVVITQPDAKANGPAVVSATLFNGGATDQTLQSIVVAGSDGKAELKPAEGQQLTVPAHGRLIIGGKDNASATLANSRESVQNGNAQKVTFTFSETGAVSLRAFVVPATSYFTEWGPSETPAAPAAATSAPAGGPSASDKPQGDNAGASAPAASPSASATPSASASN